MVFHCGIIENKIFLSSLAYLHLTRIQSSLSLRTSFPKPNLFDYLSHRTIFQYIILFNRQDKPMLHELLQSFCEIRFTPNGISQRI